MEENEIFRKLRSIPDEKWKEVLKKCHVHIELRLYDKMLSGAHCEQRLGMTAPQYYTGNAIKGLFSGTWEWKFETYDILSQLIRITDSMISEQVRKYKQEVKKGKKIDVLVQTDLFHNLPAEEENSEDDEADYLKKCHQALHNACGNDATQKKLLHLKLQGKSYPEICDSLKITPKDAYRLMEAISRRAKKYLSEENS